MSRLLFGLALILAYATLSVQSQSACSYTVDGNTYDFSSLQSGGDLPGSDGGTVYTYSLHVCGVLSSTATCTGLVPTASSCQIQGGTKPTAYITGEWGAQAPVWGYINPTQPSQGVMYQMQGAQSCWASGSPAPYYANVLFKCADASAPMTVVVNQCIQNYTIPTTLGCAPGGGNNPGGPSSSGGLSGGWIFIIILCVVIPVYVAVGCVYKRQKLGATGIDMCPNVEFWRDLPSLVRDGCVFTYTKLRSLCGGSAGGDGKGNTSYETM